MNLFNMIGNALNNISKDNKKLTSKQIWELDKMNYSTQKSIGLSLYNNTSDTNASFLKWKESSGENKLQQHQKRIVGNCEWRGTGYFEDDRNCDSCGGEIKRYKELKNKVAKKNKYVEYTTTDSNGVLFLENNLTGLIKIIPKTLYSEIPFGEGILIQKIDGRYIYTNYPNEKVRIEYS